MEHLCPHLFLFYCPNFLYEYIHKFVFNVWFQYMLNWKEKTNAMMWKSCRYELKFCNIKKKMLCNFFSLKIYIKNWKFCVVHDQMKASLTKLMCLAMFQVSFKDIWLITIYLVSQVCNVVGQYKSCHVILRTFSSRIIFS